MHALKLQEEKVLHPIKGFKELDQHTVMLAETAWSVAYTALWNGERITQHEKEECISFIKGFLIDAPHPQDGYYEFVQRVLLGRKYVIDEELIGIPAPSSWFDPNNATGFARTARWYRRMQHEDIFLPRFRRTMMIYANAILEVAKADSVRTFHQWRSYFVEKDWQNTLSLFLATVANVL